MKDIGRKIRQLREEQGMTQEELAHKVGYKSRVSINKIELQRDVPLKKLSPIAEALGVTPSSLAGWDDEEQNLNNDTAILLAKLTKNYEARMYVEKMLSLSDKDKTTIYGLIDVLWNATHQGEQQ